MTDLVYGTLRHEILLDAALADRLPAPDKLPPEVLDALRLGSYELLVRGTARHAAVDSWVEIVKVRSKRLAGLANAVLRRVELPANPPRHTLWSMPDWLAARLDLVLGDRSDEGALGMLEPEPLWLSSLGPDALSALEADGCEVSVGPVPGSLAARCPAPLAALRAFREGLVQPQNPASRLPALALDPVPGERVLDLASGNGIKTAQLAAMGARVTAVELSDKKVRRAKANLARLGLEADHLVADLRETPKGLDPARAVLLDAPCSGTGTLRGNPEIKLRLTEREIDELSDLQREMLRTAAELTSPGGILVYSVCALTPEEGSSQIDRFLEEHTDFEAQEPALPVDTIRVGEGCVVVPESGLDGFFVARLRRREL